MPDFDEEMEIETQEFSSNFEEPVEGISLDSDSSVCRCDHTTYKYVRFGEPVAKLCVKRKTWFLTEIKHLFVKEDFRRGGIATELLNYVFSNYERRTLMFMCTVNAENSIGISALTKAGFAVANSFLNPASGNNLVLMTKVMPLEEAETTNNNEVGGLDE